MKIEVSEEILSATKCCKNKVSCLNGELNLCCKVIDCVNGKLHFVESITNCYCNKKMPFGDSFFCICPTRKEIFRKYGL